MTEIVKGSEFVKEHITVSLFDKSKATWQKNKAEVDGLLRLVNFDLGQSLDGERPHSDETETAVSYPPAFKNIKKALRSRKTTTVVLKDERDNGLVGFALAMPMRMFDPHRPVPESKKRAYAYFALVKPEYQRRGLIKPAMDKLFSELSKKGYEILEIDAKNEHGFGESLERTYQSSLKEEPYDHDKWGIGDQKHLAISIKDYMQKNISASL